MQERWEKEHPGHCGRCGLPFERCVHQDPEVSDRLRRTTHFKICVGISKEAYLNVLPQMTMVELEALPKPLYMRFQDMLQEHIRARREGRIQEPPFPDEKRPSRWTLLMERS